LRRLADLRLHEVDLGREIWGRSRQNKIEAIVRTLRSLPGLLALTALVRREKIKIIHTSDRPRDALGSVLLARLTGAKSIVHVHNGYGEWMSPLLRWALKRADALIAISAFVRSTLVASGHDEARIRVVHNGINVTDWTPGTHRSECREELGIPADAPVVVTVCRLFAGKGPAELIRALGTVLRKQPETRLVIVGEEMVDGYGRYLQDLAAELDVRSHVIFAGRRSDIERIMAAADVFAMPSLEEPFGLVFLEAMAMGLPVVALRSGGAPEVVKDGETGLLAEPGDLEMLQDHLVSLLERPALRSNLGSRGRREAELHFTTRRMAQDTEAVYQWLMSSA
jgi:glycosyltransferase involved in cell wall biosynthesis